MMLPDTDGIANPVPSDVIYGVWLPLVGWLRGPKPEQGLFATLNKDLAQQQAKWFKGQVLILDDKLPDFEAQMLDAERLAQRKPHGLFTGH
jgi:hypothetical protein